jgi:hypothetical protein
MDATTTRSSNGKQNLVSQGLVSYNHEGESEDVEQSTGRTNDSEALAIQTGFDCSFVFGGQRRFNGFAASLSGSIDCG